MSAFSKQMESKIKSMLHGSEGLIIKSLGEHLVVAYMNGMVDNAQLNLNLLTPLTGNAHFDSIDKLSEMIPIGDCKSFNQLSDAIKKLLSGYALVLLEGKKGGLLVNIANIPSRAPSNADTESTIYGLLIAFTESMEKNIALLRSYITSDKLIQEEVQLAAEPQTSASLLYLDNENEKNPFVELIRKRINKRKCKGLIGSPLFLKILTDNKYALFPEMSLSERPDRTAQALLEGKVVVMVEGNSQVIIGPNSFVDFFESVEDRYSSWGLGMFSRSLRALALIISIFLTPLYVAALTFHYEMIPVPLLEPLIMSRSRVPFPPLMEALVMEVSIELLREAGARLPTKVGQTMGIVGGIVIGQAAVQAGFTSNILIMLVALAALGSFTTPNYMMSSSIRFIRFPMLIVAGFLGLIGITFFSAFLFIHLLRMTSYGKPYMYPFYPPNSKRLINTMLITESSPFQYETDLTKSNTKGGKSRVTKWFKSNNEE
ncbi:spore germination protein [Paenibacillus segetis]|uniref:Spore germination protein n=1 Tax=Paenibacillus segetis TaxID=1325360 RepID=A0ABQ1Y8F6_9BACL|nr:spore germination protein [Paenibacillus segetis]GGH15255.1 spore germination protein [Paenibacillus segetis]